MLLQMHIDAQQLFAICIFQLNTRHSIISSQLCAQIAVAFTHTSIVFFRVNAFKIEIEIR